MTAEPRSRLRESAGAHLYRATTLALVATVLALAGAPSALAQESRRFPVGDAPFSIASGDFNRDGIRDLVTTNAGRLFEPPNDTVSVLIGRRDGSFQPERRFAVGDAPTAVAVGDFNEDRRPDLAVTNGGLSDGFPGSVSILLGSGDGNFVKQPVDIQIEDGTTAPYALAVGDLDNDRHQDLAVVTFFGESVSILDGTGRGVFSAPREFRTGSEEGSSSVAVADFDRDGRRDLAVTTGREPDPDGVAVLRNRGGGNFASPRFYPTGVASFSVAVGDFNRDGDADLAVANQKEGGPSDRSQTVTVLHGVRGAGFRRSRVYQVGAAPEHVAVGDLNADGVQDLVVSNNDGEEAPDPSDPFFERVPRDDVSVLFGRPDGTFRSQVRIRTGDGPIQTVIADFDRNGLNDLAIALEGEDAVQVVYSRRNGRGRGGGIIVGTSGNDVIDCGSGDTIVDAGAGNDVIRCGPGDDQIDAGPGNDVVRGGAGNDRIFGGPGNDVLRGDGGSDDLFGNAGSDALNTSDGVAGNDSAHGGSGRDACSSDARDGRTSCR